MNTCGYHPDEFTRRARQLAIHAGCLAVDRDSRVRVLGVMRDVLENWRLLAGQLADLKRQGVDDAFGPAADLHHATRLVRRARFKIWCRHVTGAALPPYYCEGAN
jgi:hypothetical protein